MELYTVTEEPNALFTTYDCGRIEKVLRNIFQQDYKEFRTSLRYGKISHFTGNGRTISISTTLLDTKTFEKIMDMR